MFVRGTWAYASAAFPSRVPRVSAERTMLDVATARSWLDPVTYAVMQIGILAISHAADADPNCFATWKRVNRRRIILVVMKVIGVRYTMPISDAVMIPATMTAASVLNGATAEYASYEAYRIPMSG